MAKTYASKEALLLKNKAAARQLVEATYDTIEEACGPLIMAGLKMALPLGVYYEGIERDELRKWARQIGVPEETLLLSNLSYELSHLASVKILGCTSVVTQGGGSISHIRNMDWDGPLIAETTAVVDNGVYVEITNPGLYGAVSGMRHGAYSVTLNWGPPQGFEMGWSPLGLLRFVLENCETFSEAAAELESTTLNTSAIFTLVGTERACVIERTSGLYSTRGLVKGVLAATNHFVSPALRSYNDNLDPDLLEDSKRRYKEALARGAKHAGLLGALEGPNTWNENTKQRMLFNPSRDAWELA
jgi:hypothetical protein